MAINVWLDDIRDPNDHGRIGWVWVKTADEAIELLSQHEVKQISLDHDLDIEATMGNTPLEKTGYDVMLWIEEQVVTREDYNPPIMFLHTQNPSAKIKMELARDAIKRQHQTKRNPMKQLAPTNKI